MKLTKFQITNFRSINDSGPVTVEKLTSIVGRNESGKSNLLLALHTLNPPGGPKDLKAVKDFPRHRRLNECTDDTPVVSTTWELDTIEQAELVKLFPRATGVTHVDIGRRYKADRTWVGFPGLKPISFVLTEIAARVQKIKPVAEAAVEKLEDAAKQQANDAIKTFATELASNTVAAEWAAVASPSLANLRRALAGANITLGDRENGLITELEDITATIIADGPAAALAQTWAVSRLPIFVYVDEYPELTGHQNITEYLARKTSNQLTAADHNFAKMCKVAGLDPQQLNELHTAGDHETRNQLANRAGAVVTSELRRLWKDRQLKVRFSPDAQHLDTFVADPNSLYDVEVNLDERSRGLKWFFSFYITFSADTSDGGSADKAILLLDEPGLYLHALSQADLLRHFNDDFKNQIIYTTHSPFMVPTENIDAIRTVNITQDGGTTVTDTPTGDSRTLFPLQMALGFSLSQSLFVGSDNLIVEGVTDYWILSSISAYLHSIGKTGLPKTMTITPTGGAQKVGYMVALLTSERLRVLVLLDEEKQARATRDELVKTKLIRDDGVLFVSSAFTESERPNEADIEDLLDATVFDTLVRETYKSELTGKELALNANIPRIVKRYEAAFSAIGLEFYKTRPARLFLSKIAKEPNNVLPAQSVDQFIRLFEQIVQAHSRIAAKDAAPFN
jgi:energy-coupling factor transporter ATP-binding protein EcfA2